MSRWHRFSAATALACALCAITTARAAEIRHLDGVHRIEKKAEVTRRAELRERQDGDDNNVCGSSMKLCASSLSGGCCPDNYDCGVSSCYVTTRSPSTCGSLVGWYACDAERGAGCCPDGYICERGGSCLPPSGSAYTFACPASHYLCPSSFSYGCCPDGMGCAVNQCYSTEAVTITDVLTVTTTESGERRTYTTRTTSTSEPNIPTELPEIDAGDDGEQFIIKYFPSAVAKESPTASPGDNDGGGGGGLTSGQLAGIVTGAVAFLILVIVAAFIIIRHLNKVVAAVSEPRESGASSGLSRPRPDMKQFKPTDSEIDALSVDPLLTSPRPSAARLTSSSTPDAASSSDVTPSSFAGAYQAVSTIQSRHTSWDSAGNMSSYFDMLPSTKARYSVQSSTTHDPSTLNRVSGDSSGAYTHIRNWSNCSEGSTDATTLHHHHAQQQQQQQQQSAPPTLLTELEATTVGPELPGSPTTVGSPTEDYRRRSSGGMSISSVISPTTAAAHQRMRSGTVKGGELDIVDEEMHGFHGPRDRMTGKTERPGSRGSWKEGDDN